MTRDPRGGPPPGQAAGRGNPARRRARLRPPAPYQARLAHPAAPRRYQLTRKPGKIGLEQAQDLSGHTNLSVHQSRCGPSNGRSTRPPNATRRSATCTTECPVSSYHPHHPHRFGSAPSHESVGLLGDRTRLADGTGGTSDYGIRRSEESVLLKRLSDRWRRRCPRACPPAVASSSSGAASSSQRIDIISSATAINNLVDAGLAGAITGDLPVFAYDPANRIGRAVHADRPCFGTVRLHDHHLAAEGDIIADGTLINVTGARSTGAVTGGAGGFTNACEVIQ